jgi:hypothetical protein
MSLILGSLPWVNGRQHWDGESYRLRVGSWTCCPLPLAGRANPTPQGLRRGQLYVVV